MNKTWITLLIVACFTLLAIIGYEFYLSFTGAKSAFSKPSIYMPENDLGQVELNYIDSLENNIIIQDSSLD